MVTHLQRQQYMPNWRFCTRVRSMSWSLIPIAFPQSWQRGMEYQAMSLFKHGLEIRKAVRGAESRQIRSARRG
jgi:hypothetical protein